MIISKFHNETDIPYELLLQADPNKKRIDSYLSNGEIFCIEQDGRIIGLYVWMRTNTNRSEIMNISVANEYQNQGIGKRLLHHAIEQAKKEQLQTLEICTGNSSIGQLALYQRAGFRITEVEKDFFVKNYSEVITENGIPCRDKIKLTLSLYENQDRDVDGITYKVGTPITAGQAAHLFKHSGIKRPHQDTERIEAMLANANLLVTAWQEEQLVGLGRALTDFSYCCYLSDLAVLTTHQHRGIGKKLIEVVQQEIGEQAALVLLSAPQAMEYYPKVGFQHAHHAFLIPRQQ